MPVSNVKVVVPTATKYEPLPADVYHCELLDIENKMEKKWNSDEEEMRLAFTFVVIEEGEHYGRRVYAPRAPMKLSKYKGGSNLYKILSGLRGKDFTDEEMANPDAIAGDDALNALIGVQIRLSVSVKEKEKKPGEFKNVIDSYLPVKVKLPAFDADKVVHKEATTPVDKADAVAEIDFDE